MVSLASSRLVKASASPPEDFWRRAFRSSCAWLSYRGKTHPDPTTQGFPFLRSIPIARLSGVACVGTATPEGNLSCQSEASGPLT